MFLEFLISHTSPCVLLFFFVLSFHHFAKNNNISHYSVNACLLPVLAADMCHVTTVEGVGDIHHLHPVQQLMVDLHGSQCGFCTPGIIVSLYTLFTNGNSSNNSSNSNSNGRVDMGEHLDGNLCRCTGYRPIHDAAALAAELLIQVGPCGTPCRECPQADTCALHHLHHDNGELLIVSSSEDKKKQLLPTMKFADHADEWREQATKMISPEMARHHDQQDVLPLRVETSDGSCWITPTTLSGLLQILRDERPCQIVVGNTEVGIETRFKHAVYPKLIHPHECITPLYAMTVSDDATLITIGACCSLSTVMEHCHALATTATIPNHRNLARTVQPIHDMLRWFASTQIRNTACLGGNLVTASPISDMNPLLAALNAQLVLTSLDEIDNTVVRRTVPVADFFVQYRTVNLHPHELVECIEIPVLQDLEFLAPFKQARRREDDISIVTAGMRIQLAILKPPDEVVGDDGSYRYTIADAALAYGGMAPTTVLAKITARALIGAAFCADTFRTASTVLLDELNLPATVPGGQAAYRMTLATSFLHKMFLFVAKSLIAIDPTVEASLAIDPAELNSLTNFLVEPKPKYRGTQQYPAPRVAQGIEAKILPPGVTEEDTVQKVVPAAAAAAVGEAVPHASGALHCTGEAVYTDDIQLPHGTLQAALVLSSECGSLFQSMDCGPALAVAGVVGVFSYADIVKLGGSNEMGPIVHDEVVFLPPGEKVRTVGQVLGIVVAETLEQAELGAHVVKVGYEPCPDNDGKIIVTIDDAIETQSFYDFSRHGMHRGDVSVLDGLELSSTTTTTTVPQVGDTITVSGAFHSGAQEHFYLETNTSLVIPSDGGTNLTIFSSTQAPTKTQVLCASATGLPQARVAVKVKRMGGGFGGKETRSVFAAVAAAVASKRLNRPVRLTLARDVDMKLTGTRHAFQSTYRASAKVTEDGVRLLACDVKLYANGGNAYDLSGPVVDRALFHVDGCYNYPHFRAEGIVCKTVQPPHTAFRGFGGPQGMAIAEHIIDHLAMACHADPDTIRRDNLYQIGDTVPFGMVIGETDSGKWNVCDMWDRLYTGLDIKALRKEVVSYNAQHKWTKRGVSMTPTKFGIAFSSKFMVSFVKAKTTTSFLLCSHHRIRAGLWSISIPTARCWYRTEERKWDKACTPRSAKLLPKRLAYPCRMSTLMIAVPTRLPTRFPRRPPCRPICTAWPPSMLVDKSFSA
jgi:xanthine dehydrogenase/oxidase